MAPNLTVDLGSLALGFGWTLGGVAFVALVALSCIPVAVIVLAAVGDALGMSPRRAETARAQAATDGTSSAASATTGLQRAA